MKRKLDSPTRTPKKGEHEAAEQSSSDDVLSPFECSMLCSRSAGKVKKEKGVPSGRGGVPAKAKGVTSGAGARKSGSGGRARSGGGGAAADKNAVVLLEEVDKEMATLEQCTSVSQIKDETLANLSDRLGKQKTQLSNKARNDQSGEAIAMIDNINKAKNRVQSINEFVKAVLKFEKQRRSRTPKSFLTKW